MKFEVLSGKHIHSDGKTYVKGDVLETSLDMVSLFRNKFRHLPALVEKALASVAGEEGKAAKPSGKSQSKASQDGSKGLGEDVTAKFPEAGEYSLVVRKKGAWFHVYEEGAKTPLHKKGLKKQEVKTFVTKWIED